MLYIGAANIGTEYRFCGIDIASPPLCLWIRHSRSHCLLAFIEVTAMDVGREDVSGRIGFEDAVSGSDSGDLTSRQTIATSWVTVGGVSDSTA